MLTVKELKALGHSLSPAAVRKQLGPFVLVQRPPEAERPKKRQPAPLAATPVDPTNPFEPEITNVASVGAVEDGTLSLLFQFDSLAVATLPPLQGVDALTVGRLPDNDLVVSDGSVSKRHAELRWDEASKRASLQDLGSRNGTFINAGNKLIAEVSLHDGDIISFGEVQFWFLLTETLVTKLQATGSGSKLPRGV
ncbi:MAG: FHA domain-containing protein [Archangiaceae bacterium]|nr:FHA domain-containing protein [Archangiaceae bacterium]